MQAVIAALDSKECSVDEPGAQERTPLHRAVGGGNKDIVQLLIERNANIECLDKSQKTPFHWAAAMGMSLSSMRYCYL